MLNRDLLHIEKRAVRRARFSYFRGFNIVEILVVTSIAAVLAAMVAPGFSGFGDKRRVKAVAEILYTDLQFARSEAIKRNLPVRLRFRTSDAGATWCYGMTHSDVAGNCDCTITDPATPGFCFL